MRALAVLAATLLVTTCASPSAPSTHWEHPDRISYAPSLGIDLAQMEKTPSGLYWVDLTEGTGAVAGVGNTVRVFFRGWMPDGTLFDARTDPQDPLSFKLGVGLMIKGWDEGIVGMRAGGWRRLVVPPHLAYGRQGRGPIPPLTTLIFEVELREVRP